MGLGGWGGDRGGRGERTSRGELRPSWGGMTGEKISIVSMETAGQTEKRVVADRKTLVFF